MLSIHADLRNWIGQRFVEMRIKYQEVFERLFPQENLTNLSQQSKTVPDLKKTWAYKLTQAAKDDLFDMFHNKSDDFLDDVSDKRITIVGPAVDETHTDYRGFDTDEIVSVNPNLVIPAIGYRSRINDLSVGEIDVRDFYRGCCQVSHPDLFLIGFARPIIGNIPSISEVQARYVIGMLSRKISRPDDIESQHQKERLRREERFQHLNLETLYPVEMFPYCDQLAAEMGCYPSLFRIRSFFRWCRVQITPATTMHYDSEDREIREQHVRTPVYMPSILILFLLILKPFDLIYRLMIRFMGRSLLL